MKKSKDHQARMIVVAEEVLKIFSEVSESAKSHLAKTSSIHEFPPFANPDPPEQAINNLQRIVGISVENYRMLIREPAIARVMVSGDSENKEVYYICRTSYIPSFQTSYYSEYFSINTLLHQQLRKPLHQWTQTMLRPVRDVLIQHQPLPEQRMRAVLHRVRPQPPVIPQALPCRTQQGQQSNRQRTEQQHPVPTLRTRYPHRRHPHPESHVLEVAKARLNPPTLGVVAYQRARANLALTGHQAPGLLHLVVLHTHHRAHLHSPASPHPSPT